MEDDDSVVALLCGFHSNNMLVQEKLHELVMIVHVIPTLIISFTGRTKLMA